MNTIIAVLFAHVKTLRIEKRLGGGQMIAMSYKRHPTWVAHMWIRNDHCYAFDGHPAPKGFYRLLRHWGRDYLLDIESK